MSIHPHHHGITDQQTFFYLLHFYHQSLTKCLQAVAWYCQLDLLFCFFQSRRKEKLDENTTHAMFVQIFPITKNKAYWDDGFVVCDEFVQHFLVSLTTCVHNGSMDGGK